jgi:hypothetical protein
VVKTGSRQRSMPRSVPIQIFPSRSSNVIEACATSAAATFPRRSTRSSPFDPAAIQMFEPLSRIIATADPV